MLLRPRTWLKVATLLHAFCGAGCGRFGFEVLEAEDPLLESGSRGASPVSMDAGSPDEGPMADSELDGGAGKAPIDAGSSDLDSGSVAMPDSDAAITCSEGFERLWPNSCGASVPRTRCERALDADAQTRFSVSCELHPEACDFQTAGCTQDGCLRDVTLRMSLPQARRLDRLRFRSDWWEKRPVHYELWVSSDESMGPENGATLVSAAQAHGSPWVCQAGDSCAPDYVPDDCCPRGRDAPQDPATEFMALWDDLQVPAVEGRVWWLRVRDTADQSNLLMFEIELYSAQNCP